MNDFPRLCELGISLSKDEFGRTMDRLNEAFVRVENALARLNLAAMAVVTLNEEDDNSGWIGFGRTAGGDWRLFYVNRGQLNEGERHVLTSCSAAVRCMATERFPALFAKLQFEASKGIQEARESIDRANAFSAMVEQLQ